VVTDTLLNEVVVRIRSVGDPLKIVLFGSYARITARHDSDLGILIIEESPLPRSRRAPRYLRALLAVHPAKDVAVWTPSEVAEWAQVPTAFISTVLRAGKVLYERAT
jgi:uncharacterized protein